jgi:hypothetical protein
LDFDSFKMDNHFGNLSGGSNITHSNAGNHRQTFVDSECIIIRFLFVFTGSVGLLENIAVVAIILHNRIMLDFPSNWFVLSLAIADAIFCFAAIPLINALCSGASYIILKAHLHATISCIRFRMSLSEKKIFNCVHYIQYCLT